MNRWAPERKFWTARQIRNHRRPPGGIGSALATILILCGICAIPGAWPVGMIVLARVLGGWTFLALLVLVVVLVPTLQRMRVVTARRELAHWSAEADWLPATGRTEWPWSAEWPWNPDHVTVRSALGGVAEGLPVVIGELSWIHGALGGAVDSASGRGVFIVVRLPQPYASVSVQRRRQVPRRRGGEDEFVRRFRIILDDLSLADQLRNPELHEAHVTGRVLPWSITGDELYSVVVTGRPLRPATATELIQKTLFLLRLLEMRD